MRGGTGATAKRIYPTGSLRMHPKGDECGAFMRRAAARPTSSGGGFFEIEDMGKREEGFFQNFTCLSVSGAYPAK